jgi:2-amino-4-hydroxy-6-hydroxymethyldihydropteridine diphosphokinase
VNAAARLETTLTPEALLTHLHAVEDMLGRVRKIRWGARTIDLDLIAYGQRIQPDLETFGMWRDMPLEQQMTRAPEELILPHPRLQDRGFVLGPLRDIAPDWRHPVLGQTVTQMFDALPAAERAALKPIPAQN